MPIQRKRMWLLTTIVLGLLLAVVLPTSAQFVTQMNIGENRPGEITQAVPTARFSIVSGGAQTLAIQALAITPGFLPTFRVLDASNNVVVAVTNNGTQTILAGDVNLPAAGAYTIEVSSANNGFGQFLLSVQPAQSAPPPPPTPLSLGQEMRGTVSAQQRISLYSFSASQTDVLLLNVRSDSVVSGPTFTLKDATTGDTQGLVNAGLIGGRLRIPAGLTSYTLEVLHSGTTPQDSYVLCLESEAGTVTCPGSVPASPAAPVSTEEVSPAETVAAPAIPAGGPCLVGASQNVNVRSGPSTGYSIIGTLFAGTTAPVVGRMADYSWYQVNVNGVTGWVGGNVVVIGGQCGGVPVVQPPPPPGVTPSATYTPSATSTLSTGGPTPTLTPTSTPTGPTATPTSTYTPSYTPTATATTEVAPPNGTEEV